jgi:secreted trypsin-like serine protease
LQGDSGGPLTIGDKEKKLIGIVSSGKECEKGLHTLFTRVPFYLDWINEKTGITINP